MQANSFILSVSFIVLLFVSCEKRDKAADCYPGAATLRRIVEKPAVVRMNGTMMGFHLVEQGSIDTRLIPCNLPESFRRNDLEVIVTGEVKQTPQTTGICCDEAFVIEKITK